MTRTQGRAIALAFVVATFVVGQLLGSSDVFGFSPGIQKVLGILAGVLSIGSNYFPSISKPDATPVVTPKA